jgi:hypothetical protein
MTKRKIEYWVMPPEHDAACVACMEDVLAIYAEAYDAKHPVLCMDEQPVQRLKETRGPIAATTMHGTRVDDAYERNGRRPTGRSKSPTSWRRAMPIARM